jgi:hypothetical protein
MCISCTSVLEGNFLSKKCGFYTYKYGKHQSRLTLMLLKNLLATRLIKLEFTLSPLACS